METNKEAISKLEQQVHELNHLMEEQKDTIFENDSLLKEYEVR